MPTLSSLLFSFTSKAGEHIEWRSTVSVDSEGIFHLTFPAELVDVARVELKAARTTPFDPLTITQPRTQWQVQGPKLDQCKLFLERVAQAYLRTETTVDRVIMYHVGSELSYFRLANGPLFPTPVGYRRPNNNRGNGRAVRRASCSTITAWASSLRCWIASPSAAAILSPCAMRARHCPKDPGALSSTAGPISTRRRLVFQK